MRFSQDASSGSNVIRAYGEGQLRINDETFHTAMLVGSSSRQPEAGLTCVADLDSEHAVRVLALQPEVVLLGTGRRQIFPAPAFGAWFLEAGVGLEVMDTGAACRTFNVLAAEQRRVVALLFLI